MKLRLLVAEESLDKQKDIQYSCFISIYKVYRYRYICISQNDFCDCGATIDFMVATRQAQIRSSPGSRGIHFSLSIEGTEVPDSQPPPRSAGAGAMAGAASSSYDTGHPAGMRPVSRSRTDMEDDL